MVDTLWQNVKSFVFATYIIGVEKYLCNNVLSEQVNKFLVTVL